jgi:transposase-like protein
MTRAEKGCMIELLRLLGRDWSALLTESRKSPFCPRCPKCQERATKHRPNEAHGYDYRCHHCGRVFNAWSGTVFEKTHRTPTKLATLVFGFLLKISASRFQRDLGWHKTSVRRCFKKLERHEGLVRLTDGGTLNGVGFNDIAEHVPGSLRGKWMTSLADRPFSYEV